MINKVCIAGLILAISGASALADAGCADLLKLRSQKADTATSMVFSASGTGEFKVYWIDYDGARVLYNSLRGGG